jgi:proline iminopeptidase
MYLEKGSRRIFYDIASPHLGWRDGKLVVRPVIITIHGGLGFSSLYFRPWLSRLAEGYCVIYVDLPGSGMSSRHIGSEYPLEELIEDLDGVRACLGIEKVILLGHAWGSILAAEYALSCPAVVDALVMVNPLRILTAEGQDGEAQQRMITATDPTVAEEHMRDLDPKIQRALEGERGLWPEIDRDSSWIRLLRTQLNTAPTGWDTMMKNIQLGMEAYFAHKGNAMSNPDHPLARYDLAERVANLTCPLLIVAGDSDANYVALPEKHARPIHAALPGSELQIVVGGSHFLFAEDPDGFAGIVTDFLRRQGYLPAETDSSLL